MKTAQFSHKPNNTDISLMALNFYFPPCKGSPVSNVPGQGQAPMGLAERKSSSPGLEVHYFDSVVLKIKLLLFFQYCHCFHNLEFYKVNIMIVYFF